ncbi:MAG: hypothetical protein GC136_10305 [Alphaproteobacteria bacterium]|nr:hypothetical protein [Alphaproteobacteria bacterium]
MPQDLEAARRIAIARKDISIADHIEGRRDNPAGVALAVAIGFSLAALGMVEAANQWERNGVAADQARIEALANNR